MGRVFNEVQCAYPERLLLLALADHAHDDGSNIFPSVKYVCWKTSLSESFVRKKLALWRDDEVLTIVDGNRGRGVTVEYFLNIDALPVKQPFEGKKVGSARAERLATARKLKGVRDTPFK